MVDLVPNRDIFENIYPEDSDDDSDACEECDEDDSDNESDLLKSLALEKKENEHCIKQASEERASASAQLAMLENYARTLEKDRPEDLGECVTVYREERKGVFNLHFASEAKLQDLENQRADILKRHAKAFRNTLKEKEKAENEQRKKLEKKTRARQEK